METNDLIIDAILELYRPVLLHDFNKYKNHVYRVYLNCIQIDSSHDNKVKYAIAAVFHDIGIWTCNTFDYINPSLVEANKYLGKSEIFEMFEEIKCMIIFHHKVFPYKGTYPLIVETFRKADWMDVTYGVFVFGKKSKQIKTWQKIYPALGFHRFLLKSAIRHFLKKPFNPLPMFKI